MRSERKVNVPVFPNLSHHAHRFLHRPRERDERVPGAAHHRRDRGVGGVADAEDDGHPRSPLQHHPVAQRICFLVDQADSVVGGLLAVSLAVPVPRATWLCLTFGGAATHLAFNYGLMRMGLRERAA